MNRSFMVSLGAVVVLAACGGGGGDAAPAPAADPTEAVPASASSSVDGMWNYLKRLAALLPDDKEALDVSGFAPPKPDDAEPAAVQ